MPGCDLAFDETRDFVIERNHPVHGLHLRATTMARAAEAGNRGPDRCWRTSGPLAAAMRWSAIWHAPCAPAISIPEAKDTTSERDL